MFFRAILICVGQLDHTVYIFKWLLFGWYNLELSHFGKDEEAILHTQTSKTTQKMEIQVQGWLRPIQFVILQFARMD
jgi:hypothetical protein